MTWCQVIQARDKDPSGYSKSVLAKAKKKGYNQCKECLSLQHTKTYCVACGNGLEAIE